MKIYLVITTLAVLVSVSLCKPGRDVVEIQKQRLVKLSSDSPRYQSYAETPETQRILQEIERINLAMGYKKKAQQLPVQRSNIQLDYFYPREEYRPFVLQRSSMLNRGSARWQTQSLTSWPARPAVSARFIQAPIIGAAPSVFNTIPQNLHPVQHTAVDAGHIPLNPALYTPYGHPLPPSALDVGQIQPVQPVQPVQPEIVPTDQATENKPKQDTNPESLQPGQVITPTTLNTLPQPLHPGQAPVSPSIFNTLAYPVHPGFLTAGQLPINTAFYHTYAQPLPPTAVDVNQTPIDPIIYNSIPPTSVGAGTAPGALPIDPIEIPKGTPLPLEPVKPGNDSDPANEQPNQEDSTELIFPPTTDDPEAFSTTEPTTQLPKDTMKLVDGTKSTIVKNINAGTGQSARPQKLKAQSERQQQRRTKQKKPKAKSQAQGKTTADVQVLRAVQQQNARFVVDQIYYVPGRVVPELSSVERVRVAPQKLVAASANTPKVKMQVKSLRLRKIQATPLVPGQQSQTFIIAPSQTKAQIQARKQMRLQAQLQAQIKAQKESIRKQQQQEQEDEEEYDVIADAIGSTSADKPIPGVPVETYFPDYNPARIPNPEGEATLILEPSAKAIAGQDGIAISAPLSRAILRPGVTTRVLFRPDSVAIVGPGGKAHAQADLILDFLGDY